MCRAEIAGRNDVLALGDRGGHHVKGEVVNEVLGLKLEHIPVEFSWLSHTGVRKKGCMFRVPPFLLDVRSRVVSVFLLDGCDRLGRCVCITCGSATSSR